MLQKKLCIIIIVFLNAGFLYRLWDIFFLYQDAFDLS